MGINLHQAYHFISHLLFAKRKGHGIHSPFAFQLCEEVFYNVHSFYDFKLLNAIRTGLLMNELELQIDDHGAGSKTFKNNFRKIKEIAAKGISTSSQSELLYRLVNFLKCNTLVELGTSIGLNALYLAKTSKEATVISIEGSKSLVDFAAQLAIKNNVHNIQFIHSHFDVALPEVLLKTNSLDLLYIDGNHKYESTLNYFRLSIEKKHNDSVFVFDDIYWSKEMKKAWEEIKKHPEVSLSIDTFYTGFVFFKKEVKEKQHLRLFVARN